MGIVKGKKEGCGWRQVRMAVIEDSPSLGEVSEEGQHSLGHFSILLRPVPGEDTEFPDQRRPEYVGKLPHVYAARYALWNEGRGA